MKKVKVVSSLISTGTFKEFVDTIFDFTDNRLSSYVCCANVHMVVEAYQDKAFNKMLNEADLVTPDGRPISVVIKLFDKIAQERVAGMDLLPILLKEAEIRGKSVYFYGSTEEVLTKIRTQIAADFPKLRIAGTYSPPFRPLSEEEDQQIINNINGSGADLVFVSLGCPKQEKWMAAHKGKVNACMLGVGQAFLTYTGLEKRLPKWARDWSLEWAYRLYLEPKRLWRRYVIGNSIFLFFVFKRLIFRTY
ncbi:MAG: glycosyltransferase [Cytophagales bacterium]|nr:MAG: glycosyltransferase [Cytophagales bacterium]